MKAVVCFAVKEEARFFNPQPGSDLRVVLTGMGRRNAEKALGRVLQEEKPECVLSCGFAGGLRPGLSLGQVVFAVDPQTGFEKPLLAAGAQPAHFHCAERVATTRAEKQDLWQRTHADAVEMESEVICALCRAQGIPSGTARVILDTAEEDLPLDFNRLMTADQRLCLGKLTWALVRSPCKLGALMRLRRQSEKAARNLSETLEKALVARFNNQ